LKQIDLKRHIVRHPVAAHAFLHCLMGLPVSSRAAAYR
jgi:hypothetical protein